MLQTVTIDIINDKALNLLMDLERLKLIRLHREIKSLSNTNSIRKKYKGAITRQPQHDVDNQLKELREGWE